MSLEPTDRLAATSDRTTVDEMWVWSLVAVLFLALGAPLEAGELRVSGAIFGRASGVESQPSWLSGGFGRLGESGKGPGVGDSAFRGEAHLGLDWRPSEVIQVHVHGVGRAQPSEVQGNAVGLVEAFAAYRPQLTPKLSLHLKAGTFFPPTSRENVDPLWQSRYTITPSALNSWIGEEVRLAGLEAGVVVRSERGDELQALGGVFGVNDTSGTLLAWRGFALGDHLASLNESLPLPPLRTLAPGQGFGSQREDGTRPIDELDRSPGFYGRARWERPNRALVQAAWFDNRGDRELHRGQYAWRTQYGQAGLELHAGRVALIAEGASGKTGMGARTGAHVDLDFRTVYALVTWASERFRLSGRYDRFETEDQDGGWEPNDETGDAVTLAAFFQASKHLRLGLEVVDLRSSRPAAADSGRNPDTDARKATFEARFQL